MKNNTVVNSFSLFGCKIINYEHVSDVSILEVFGYPVYVRVCDVCAVFNIVFKLN